MYGEVDEVLHQDEGEGGKLGYEDSQADEAQRGDGVFPTVGAYESEGEDDAHQLGEDLHKGVGSHAADSYEIAVKGDGEGYRRERGGKDTDEWQSLRSGNDAEADKAREDEKDEAGQRAENGRIG